MHQYSEHTEKASERRKGGASAAGWTPERVALLRELWTAGKSAAEIARALGHVSRNAVIGKVLRLKLQPRSAQALKQRRAEAVKRPPKPRAKAATWAITSAAEARAPTLLPPPTPYDGPIPPAPDRGYCQWIEGDPRSAHTWCGEPAVPGTSWCAHHRQRAYTHSGGFRHG